jgi:hypothetical protein
MRGNVDMKWGHMNRTIALGLLACAALAGCGSTTPRAQQAALRATVRGLTAAGALSAVHLSISPASLEVDLQRDPTTGDFTGLLFVPAGEQTLTATAFAGATRVGRGSTTVTVADKVESAVVLTILDETGPGPTPDHSPIVTSLTAPASPSSGQPVSLSASAVDPDGDPVTYQWSSSCGGAFSAAGATTTGWTPAAAGPCTLTFSASSNGLTDHVDVLVAVDGVSTCSDLADVSAPVQRRYVAQPAPAPAGGVITDGLYVIASSLEYIGPGGPSGGTGETQQMTLRIQGDRVDVASARDGQQSGTITARDGTSFTVSFTCPALRTMTIRYTASPTSLALYDADGPDRVQIFTLQGVSACTSLPDLGGLVEDVLVAQDAPPTTGGAISDGTYALKQRISYTGASGASGGTGSFHRGMVRFQGNQVEHVGDEKRESGTYAVTGSTLTVSLSCPIAETFVASYSATPTGLSILDPASGQVEVYEIIPTSP